MNREPLRVLVLAEPELLRDSLVRAFTRSGIKTVDLVPDESDSAPASPDVLVASRGDATLQADLAPAVIVIDQKGGEPLVGFRNHHEVRRCAPSFRALLDLLREVAEPEPSG